MEQNTCSFLKEVFDGRLIVMEAKSGKTIFDFDEVATREVYIGSHQITVLRPDTHKITVIPVREILRVEGY